MSDATLVFDDDCGFCTWWARRVADRSDLRTVGFSDLSADLRERLPDDYEECSHLVTDDAVYSCGASVEEAIVRTDVGERAGPVVDFLRNFEDYDRVRERAYRWGADRRDVWGQHLSETPPARDGSGTSEDGDGA